VVQALVAAGDDRYRRGAVLRRGLVQDPIGYGMGMEQRIANLEGLLVRAGMAVSYADRK